MTTSTLVRPLAGIAGALLLTAALGACVSKAKSMDTSPQGSMSSSMDNTKKKGSDSTMMTAKPKKGSTSTMSGTASMSGSTSKQ